MEFTDRVFAANVLKIVLDSGENGIDFEELSDMARIVYSMPLKQTQQCLDELCEADMVKKNDGGIFVYTPVNPSDYGKTPDASINAVLNSDKPETWNDPTYVPLDESDPAYQDGYRFRVDRDGTLYSGEMKDGFPDGIGISDGWGGHYTGSFEMGMFHGEGTLDNGSITVSGNWEYDEANGAGKVTLPNGTTVESDDISYSILESKLSFGNRGGHVTFPSGKKKRFEKLEAVTATVIVADVGHFRSDSDKFRQYVHVAIHNVWCRSQGDEQVSVATFSDDYRVKLNFTPCKDALDQFLAWRMNPRFGEVSNLTQALQHAKEQLDSYTSKAASKGVIVTDCKIVVLSNGMFDDTPITPIEDYDGIEVIAMPFESLYVNVVEKKFCKVKDCCHKSTNKRFSRHDRTDIVNTLKRNPNGLTFEELLTKTYWMNGNEIRNAIGILKFTGKIKEVSGLLKARNYIQSRMDHFMV
ncbi:MAG: hypothetical protein MJZ21_01135 [archaeon]|nr:hypothetical protein [archaeon]